MFPMCGRIILNWLNFQSIASELDFDPMNNEDAAVPAPVVFH
jgi:hypothetical protein